MLVTRFIVGVRQRHSHRNILRVAILAKNLVRSTSLKRSQLDSTLDGYLCTQGHRLHVCNKCFALTTSKQTRGLGTSGCGLVDQYDKN